MLKMKLMAFLKNPIAKKSLIILLAILIICNIVFLVLPESKAGSQINVAFRSATMNVNVGNKDLMMPEVSPGQSDYNNKKNTYNNTYCIDEGTDLSFETYTKEMNLYNSGESSKYFKNYNAALWLVDNMYITTASNAGDSLYYLADLVTSPDVKKKVTSYGNVTSDNIRSLNKTVGNGKDLKGNSINRNLIEVIEQLVLWNYTNNSNSNLNPDSLINGGISGSNISSGDQNTCKYLYYALKYLANSNSSKYSSNGKKANIVTLESSKASINTSKNQVGPYYLKANGVVMNIDSKIKGKISATVTKTDGTTKNLGSDKIKVNSDGSFYINISGCGNVKSTELKVNGIYSGAESKAVVLTSGKTQNLLNIKKSIKNRNLSNKKEINYSGKFNVKLIKVSADGKTVVKNNPATFSITGAETKSKVKTGNDGVLKISENKTIKTANDTYTYNIVEDSAPSGFTKYDGKIVLTVKFKISGNKFIINKDTTKLDAKGTNGTVKMSVTDDTTVQIYVPNTPTEPEKYNINLVKVDKNGKTIENNPATFSISGAENKSKVKTNDAGILKITENRSISSEEATDTYKIVEDDAPSGYEKYNGDINLNVKFKKDGNKLVLDKEATKLESTGNNGEVKLNFVDDATIEIYVPNTDSTKPVFDLSLRKFISKIDDKALEVSREPVIDETSKQILDADKTAAYHHTKQSLTVKEGSKIEYTLRVYNEGEKDGYAKEITDYLPDGLSFVKIADESAKEYTTDATSESKKIVLKYTGNTAIKANSIDRILKNEKDNIYQEVKIICEVKAGATGYLTNRAEITNYGYDDNGIWKEAKEIGNVDRDSIENTISGSLGLDKWYENSKSYTYTDSTGKTVTIEDYYPGVQDDDDFETVEVISGAYNVVIKKVDASNNNQGLEGAYFTIDNSTTPIGPTGKNGTIDVLKNQPITSAKDTKTITIKESKAPEGYKGYDKEIVLNIATKSENDKLVLDKDNTKLANSDTKVSLNIDLSTSTITITIPNEKKEFDLALRKFITKVNDKDITNREPKVDISELKAGTSTTAKYEHTKDPVDVCTNDIVTYTLRIYNEGELSGYATKIMDDIPQGLEFLPEYETNVTYNWKMYTETTDENAKDAISYNGKKYVQTTDATKADVIITDYLKDKLINGFDSNTMQELEYKDVKVSFKVIEPNESDRVIINYAQITDDADSNGNSVTDRDSNPNEWNEGEDDQDIEKIKVKYFDLSLRKWVTEAIVTENGQTQVTKTGHKAEDNPEEIVKVDLKKSKINDITVKFRYSIRVTNEGEIAGYAKEISDYIPNGLKFVAEDNPQWSEVDGKVVTDALANTLLQPGESAEVEILLTWINSSSNMGVMINTAEISKDYNEHGIPDRDSTPNNKVEGEDDIDDAPVMLTVKTGSRVIAYVSLVLEVLAIIGIGITQIKKHIDRI